MYYVYSKILCVDYCELDFEEGSKGFIWVSETDPAKKSKNWLKELYDAPVGSIFLRPKSLVAEQSAFFEQSKVKYCKNRFVKTSHMQLMLKKFQTGKEMRDANAPVIMLQHGNSGLGKTHAADLIATVASLEKLFLIKMGQDQYKSCWSSELQGKGEYKRVFVQQMEKWNSEVVWEKYMGRKTSSCMSRQK